MKCLFWNIRGLANSPTRLALKRLIVLHKPDIILIAEPWIPFNCFPFYWLNRLNLKLFALNNRPNLIPNLWCICSKNLNPNIINIDNQQVSFTITDNNKIFGFNAVYASTNYITRRQLWYNLQNIQNQHNIPWCSIGDFNAILGSHEHRGFTNPARLPMEEFFNWSDSNNLYHIPTRGAQYTWTNGRGARQTERRLDRAICNQLWLDSCASLAVTTLTKFKSDHFPILLDFKTSNVTHATQFRFMRMWVLHDDCRRIITETWNDQIIGNPMYVLSAKLKNLKYKLKDWNHNVFGNVHTIVKDAENKLAAIQENIDNTGMTDSLLEQQKLAQINLENALNKEEAFWQERARSKWHVEGDRNTNYFHRLANIKTKTKPITAIKVDDNIVDDPEQIAILFKNHFQNLFSSNIVLQVDSLVEDVIPTLISDYTNNLLTLVPSQEEIKKAVFELNKDSAPGPDGFGAIFFQTYWNIINKDVCNAVVEFFTKSWMPPTYNSNTIVLIPKNEQADSVEQFRPIALANFKFKIITKILADRLAPIMKSIISKEQRGFIQGRNIRDCICTTSEAINLLHNRCFGGNVAFKVDIAKAFDTLEWSFLLKVLKQFGFNDVFCNWIEVILHSANLSISINGKHYGFFKCKRGVRQGDPLSPLLFCLAEDVLSRSIGNLVDQGKLDLIKGSRNHCVPSHTLYADDIMVFCKAKAASIQALKDLFQRYAAVSGQMVNPAKSTMYAGSISNSRISQIADQTGFNIGSLPFNYLGVPIFKGKPKARFLLPIADKIKSKLGAWKASLLSIAGRVQLVKSVIQGMLIHSIAVYNWPISLLKDLEKWIRNFIWSGDVNKRKLVTVSWNKCCKPISQGGLGIRSLISLNEASNLKLCWDIRNSNESWATLLRSRVIRNRRPISHHIYSSIWSSIKNEFDTTTEQASWLIGNGESVNFWNDEWCGVSLTSTLNIPVHISQNLQATVADFIINGVWSIPQIVQMAFPAINSLVHKVTIPTDAVEDKLVWKNAANGELSLKDAYIFKAHCTQNIGWAKKIWSKDIPPSKSLLCWRLMHNRIPTDDNLVLRGCSLASMCSNCNKYVETSFHLFFECSFAKYLWNWFAGILNLPIQVSNLEDIWKICDRRWSPQCKLVVQAGIVNIISSIWYRRNQARFKDKLIHRKLSINNIVSSVCMSGSNTTKVSSPDMREFSILKSFRVPIKPPNAPRVIEVIWTPPIFDWVKVNTDGAATKSPTNAAAGGIFRDRDGNCIGCFAQNLVNGNAFHSELMAAIIAMEVAQREGWFNLWLETDSQLVYLAMKSSASVPWILRNRWHNCLAFVRGINFTFSHVYREGNACADGLANIGLALPPNSFVWHTNIPDGIREEYSRNRLGLPNYRFVNF